jgi:hypothetical protein
MALLEDALNRIRKLPGPAQARFVWIRQTLALVYDRAGQLAKSEPLYREFVEEAYRHVGADHRQTAPSLAMLGANLLDQKKYAAAERVLRQCLAIRVRTEPEAWTTFNARSLLGAALLGRQRYAQAEPLLLAGYEGMKQRSATAPEPWRSLRLSQALERLVRLYDAQSNKDEAAKWRKQLEALEASRRTQPPGQK